MTKSDKLPQQKEQTRAEKLSKALKQNLSRRKKVAQQSLKVKNADSD